MPTLPRSPRAHRHREQLQARRLRAAELFPLASTKARSPASSASPAKPSAVGMPPGKPVGPMRCAATDRQA
jgi:hypothetical protein